MEELRLIPGRATRRDSAAVVTLIDAAAAWLQTKGTDQWAQPWPSKSGRRHRIKRALRAGKTWIIWDGRTPAATITLDSVDSLAWPAELRRDPSVYVSRLVVNRSYAGLGLGSQLLSWAGLRARRAFGAQWIRVDVWTTNLALHEYYRQQGFEFCGLCRSIPGYPSAALFQKPTSSIAEPAAPLFREIVSDSGSLGRKAQRLVRAWTKRV